MPCFTTERVANVRCGKCGETIVGIVHVAQVYFPDIGEGHQDMFHPECCPEKESHESR